MNQETLPYREPHGHLREIFHVRFVNQIAHHQDKPYTVSDAMMGFVNEYRLLLVVIFDYEAPPLHVI